MIEHTAVIGSVFYFFGGDEKIPKPVGIWGKL